MQIQILETQDDFTGFAEGWKKLHARSTDPDPFASFEWSHTWYTYRYAGSFTPFIVAGFEKRLQEPCFVIPLMIDIKGRVRFIADGHSDRNLFLFGPEVGTPAKHTLFKKIFSMLKDHPKVRSLELKNLSQSDHDFALFSALGGETSTLFKSNAVSWLDLEPSVDPWHCFGYLGSKKRSELKRIYKKSADLRGSILQKGETPFPEEEIADLAEAMIASGIRDGNFLNPVLRKVIASLYEAGILAVHKLTGADNEIQALNLLLKNPARNEWLLWIDLYRERPFVNIASYIHLIHLLCRTVEAPFRIHFGRGLYEYKLKNFLPQVEAQFTIYWSKGAVPLGLYLAKNALLSAVKPFYKQHKSTINRILGR